MSSCVQFSIPFKNLEKVKNQVTASKKHRKIGIFLLPEVTFSLAVTKRLKLKEKFKRNVQWDCFSFPKMYL